MKNICQSCGLCCDGTMYTHVSLEDADNQERLVSLGLHLRNGQSEPCFDQPCVAYQSGSCSIYASRPAICRAYRCALLRTLDKDEISLGQAQKLVAEVVSLRDRVARKVCEYLGTTEPISLVKLFDQMTQKLEKMSTEERHQVDSAMLLEVGTLRVLLSKRFEPRGTNLTRQAEQGNVDKPGVDGAGLESRPVEQDGDSR